MRKLTFGMNLTLDGYIAAPGDDLGWSVPSDELFQWWSDRVGATGLALYGRKLWETMSSHWPTADQQPGATPAEIEFARRWQDMPKVVFSSTISTVDWNTRLVTGDAVTEITRLKAEDGGSMDIGGATLAAAAMRAGADRRVRDRHPPGPGGRRHTVLRGPGQLGGPGSGGDPDVSRRRAPDQVRDQAVSARCQIGSGSAVALEGPLEDTIAGAPEGGSPAAGLARQRRITWRVHLLELGTSQHHGFPRDPAARPMSSWLPAGPSS